MAKKIPYLSLFLIIGTLIFLAFIIQKIPFEFRFPAESLPPLRVVFSNFGPDRLTVSWFTGNKTTGAVAFCPQRNQIENYPESCQIVSNSRGTEILSLTHYIQLKNLRPDQTYYLALKSGSDYYFQELDGRWSQQGFAAEIKTPPLINFDPAKPVSPLNTPGSYSLENQAWNLCLDPEKNKETRPCFRPNFLQGKTIDAQGQVITEAIIFAQIPGKSSVLSVLSDKNGQWQLNLGDFFSWDLSRRLTYDPGTDLIRLKAENSLGQSVSKYEPIPQIIPTECFDWFSINCQKKISGISSPISLILSLPQGSSPQLSPTPVEKTNHPNEKNFGLNSNQKIER